MSNYPLWIPKDKFKKLKFIAGYNGRSANKEIEILITKHIEQFEKEKVQ